MLSNTSKPLKTTQSSLVNHYGIRSTSKLIWRRWIVGEEYTKNLTITNTMPFSMQLTYRPPEKVIKREGNIRSSAFSTLYPKPILLSAGSTFVIPVSFRPISYNSFEDDIEFSVTAYINDEKIGKTIGVNTSGVLEFNFKVGLKAVLPEAKLKVPKKISMEPCAVLDCAMANFTVSNPSLDTSVNVSFDVDLPFSIQTSEINLEPQTSQTVSVKFEPQRAGLFRANIKCHYYNRENPANTDKSEQNNIEVQTKRIHVTSCSKYPHLQCTNEVDFGAVALGKSKTKTIEIANMGTVPTPITIERVLLDEWQKEANLSFELSTDSAVLGEKGSENDTCKLSITYTPHQSEITTVRSFKIIACGSLSILKLKCSGQIQRPQVVSIIDNCEEINTLDYGMTEVGRLYKLRVTLYNKSAAAAYYTLSGLSILNGDGEQRGESVFYMAQNELTDRSVQKINDDDEDFSNSGGSGLLPGKARRRLIINFRPQFPMAYYRRVALLVHQQEPQFITLMGTARDASKQPAVLEEYHAANSKINELNGICGFPPNKLLEKISTGELIQNPENLGLLLRKDGKLDSQHHQLSPYSSAFDEFFDDGTVQDLCYLPPELQLEKSSIDFGKCEVNRSYSQTITMTNNTTGCVTVVWSKSHNFTVDPCITEIPADSAARFRIVTKINEPDKFYGKTLECYGCYTEQLDYRKVNKHLIQPSWHSDLTVTANTFHSNPYSATVRFNERDLNLPALPPGQATYGTFILENHDTSTPVLYQLRLDEEVTKKTGYCIVKPMTALVQASYEVLVVRLKATPDCTHPNQAIGSCETNNTQLSSLPLRSNVKFTFNANKQVHAITVQGFAAWPVVSMPSNLYFRPTCVGTSSERTETIQNRSPLNINFQWVACNDSDSRILEISPKTGTIQPGDCCTFKVRFSPKTAGNYEIRAKLFVKCRSTHLSQSNFLTCHAMASEGKLCVKNSHLNLGSVIVGRPVEYTLPLLNKAECDVPWRIWLKEKSGKDCGISVNPMTGVLPAKAKCDVSVVITPKSEGKLDFSCISSCATNLHESPARLKKQNMDNHDVLQSLCGIQMEAVYPNVKIISVSGHNANESISSQHLERWLNVEKFNNTLVEKCGNGVTPRTEDELYNANADISMSLGAAPISSKQTMVTDICLKNCGSVPAKFKVILPKDLRVKTPHWASPDIMPKGTQMHGLQVEEQKLFEFLPSSGCLKPGEECTVSVTFDPRTMPGRNTQRIAFHLDGGPCLVADVYAISVPRDEKYLHVMPMHHLENSSVCSGQTTYTQFYPVFNGSNKPVSYTIDVCDETSNEFGENILECLQPEGEISARAFTYIPFNFTPLEVREYAMDIFVGIEGSQKNRNLVTFLGKGSLTNERPSNSLITEPLRNYVKGELNISISQSLINIGRVPMFSRTTKTVFMKNNHPNEPVLFRFTKFDRNIVTINSEKGMLNAGEYVTISIIYHASPPERVFLDEITCEVVSANECSEYRGQVEEFKKAKTRADFEFVIEDRTERSFKMQESTLKNVQDKKHYEIQETSALHDSRSEKTVKSKVHSPQKPATHNTTFPRQNSTIPVNSRASRYRQSTKVETSLEPPKKPDTLLLHITLSGESKLGSTASRGLTFFNIKKSSGTVGKVSDSNIYDGEPELMEDLVGDLIQDILQGSDLLNNVEVLERVEPPKYSQLHDRKKDRGMTRENTEPNLFKTILQHDINVVCEKAIPDIPALAMTTELLEDTIKNILSEAVHEEFIITSPHRFIYESEQKIN